MNPRIILVYVPERYRAALPFSPIVHSFDEYVRPIIELVDRVDGFGLLRSNPTIRAYHSPDLDCQREIISSFTTPAEQKAIRIVACDETDTFDPVIFEGSRLCITIHLSDKACGIWPTTLGVHGARITIPPERLLNAIVDIQLDIAFSNSDALKRVVSRAIAELGEAGFYRRKAAFYSAKSNPSYLGPIDPVAQYAPISPFARIGARRNGDLGGALAALWDDFLISHLSEFLPSRQEVIADLRSLPVVGKQLATRSIQRLVGDLRPGVHRLAILRRSVTIRSGPEMRNLIQSIFGNNASPGTVKLVGGREAEQLARHPSLVKHDWIALRRFYVKETADDQKEVA